MEIKLVKSIIIHTRKTKAIVFGEENNYLYREEKELGHYNSIDEAIYYAMAHMITDICNEQKSEGRHYGFTVIEPYEQETLCEYGNNIYANGFDYQAESNSPCGYDIVEMRYMVKVKKW